MGLFNFFSNEQLQMEALQKPVIKDENNIKRPSSYTKPDNIDRNLSDDNDITNWSFSNLNDTNYSITMGDEESVIGYQAKIIDKYRKIANDPEISNAIDIIVNEAIFTTEPETLTIDIDEENDSLKNKISDTFDKVQKLLNIKENIVPIFRQMYIDGQMNIVLVYDESNKNDGIRKASVISPQYLYFDKENRVWKYKKPSEEDYTIYSTQDEYDETYSLDELVHADYGLDTKIKLGEKEYKINIGYLENVQKILNRLNTLEDMLVPMRYSRSVSRRLFNIDVADLPPAKAKQLMDEIRREFKYKKSYDIKTGTITNMTSTHPLVEDYWMANRSGARGTTVEMMDEKGQLMDLDDIMLTGKKLYAALKIPSNRNPYADEDGGGMFNYSSDREITNEELQFYLFIERLRLPFLKLLKEILRRELIYTGVMSEQEWTKYQDKISVDFTSASVYMENMRKDLYLRGIENFTTIRENIGKVISLESAVSQTLGMNSVELKEELEKIQEEKQDPLYKLFYSSNTDDF